MVTSKPGRKSEPSSAARIDQSELARRRPHIAVVGRVGHSESFRNVQRYEVTTHPGVLAIRVDESLYFANTKYLQDAPLDKVAEHRAVEHLLLVGSGINYVDASAVETLRELIERLHDAGVALHLADVKGPVLDQLYRAGLIGELGEDHLFLSAHEALAALAARSRRSSELRGTIVAV